MPNTQPGDCHATPLETVPFPPSSLRQLEANSRPLRDNTVTGPTSKQQTLNITPSGIAFEVLLIRQSDSLSQPRTNNVSVIPNFTTSPDDSTFKLIIPTIGSLHKSSGEAPVATARPTRPLHSFFLPSRNALHNRSAYRLISQDGPATSEEDTSFAGARLLYLSLRMLS